LIDLHPQCDLAKPFLLLDRQLAIRLRPDVQQEISALRPRLDKEIDQLAARFVDLVLRLILPGSAHRVARLPGAIERDAGNI
jgi:hypothetical protein